jgi:hypothetical protein
MIANIHHGVSKVIRFGGQTLDKFGRVFEHNAYIEKCMQSHSCVFRYNSLTFLLLFISF